MVGAYRVPLIRCSRGTAGSRARTAASCSRRAPASRHPRLPGRARRPDPRRGRARGLEHRRPRPRPPRRRPRGEHFLKPAAPSVTFGVAPGPLQRVLAYVGLGIQHIALEVDHLLFVLGLLLIVPSRLTLVKTISAFTVAHSITLAAATLGVASVPAAPVEAAIALSILFLGPEIVRSWRGGTSLTLRHPWVVAFAFGLLHGFGFAGGLAAMGLPKADIPLALLLFNVGVELGQLAFVAFVILLERSSRALSPLAAPGRGAARLRGRLARRLLDAPARGVAMAGADLKWA